MDGGFFRQKHGVKSGDLAIDLQRSNSHATHANALLPAWLPAHTRLRRVQVKREFSTRERPVRGLAAAPGARVSAWHRRGRRYSFPRGVRAIRIGENQSFPEIGDDSHGEDAIGT